MESTILIALLLIIEFIVAVLMLIGKVKLVIVYPKEEQPAPWPEKEEDEEPVANYVKPAEKEKSAQKVGPSHLDSVAGEVK